MSRKKSGVLTRTRAAKRLQISVDDLPSTPESWSAQQTERLAIALSGLNWRDRLRANG